MRNKLLVAIVVATLFPLVSCANRSAGVKKYNGPACISKFCLDKEFIKQREIVKLYGNGFYISSKFPYHCFSTSKQNEFIYFDIYHGSPKVVLSIFLSDTAACQSTKMPIMGFGKLTTKKGLTLGDSRDKVIKLYGSPDMTGKGDGTRHHGLDRQKAESTSPFGDEVLHYVSKSDILMSSAIYIRDGKVSAILVSTSP